MRGLVMNLGARALLPIFILLSILIFYKTESAISQTVTEPPVPVYFIQQNEKARISYEDSLKIQKLTLAEANRKIDSLQSEIQRLSSVGSNQFTWHYTIIALLITTVIGLLLLMSYIRKEQPQGRRTEKN
jgi:hypothetical protein